MPKVRPVRDDSDLTILSSLMKYVEDNGSVRDDSDLTILSSSKVGAILAYRLEMILI